MRVTTGSRFALASFHSIRPASASKPAFTTRAQLFQGHEPLSFGPETERQIR